MRVADDHRLPECGELAPTDSTNAGSLRPPAPRMRVADAQATGSPGNQDWPAAQIAPFRALADARSDEAPTYTADAHTESMVPEIDAAQARPIVIRMRRVDQEWHAHLDHVELRPDPLAYDPAEGIRLHTMISDAIAPQFQSLTAEMTRRFDEIDRRFDGIDRRLDGIDRRLNEHGDKLDTLIAQMWVALALMGVALILAFAILGLLLVR